MRKFILFILPVFDFFRSEAQEAKFSSIESAYVQAIYSVRVL